MADLPVARWEGGRALVLSHADSCTGRANQTVRLSVDNGKTVRATRGG